MPYITREDGEHFVIPSYRDVLTVKQKSQLKKEILLLSQSYGEYITLGRKGASQYEVAFSPDTGYLLGESVWHFFKRPLDMIYCEAIPNTTEAILVIVKAGSVYLDGSFPVESIPEELVIFLTQENNFDIYIHGDVPISSIPETGKFSFEPSSVKSFTVLEKPIFPTLPLLKIYQLQLVDQVLKAQGIGVFPVRYAVIGILVIAGVYMLWSFISTRKVEVAPPPPTNVPNPYAPYLSALNSPNPEDQINIFLDQVKTLYTMPGWKADNLSFSGGGIVATVTSYGGSLKELNAWADYNHYSVSMSKNGFGVSASGSAYLKNRPIPKEIYPFKTIVAEFTDRLANVYPGNNVSLGVITNKVVFNEATITINVRDVSIVQIALIGQTFKDLPFVLQNVNVNLDESGTGLTGTIIIEALGN